MKHYELLALVAGTLSEEETAAAQQTIRTILEKQSAQISKQDVWEKRNLAYPVGRTRQGTYLLYTFDGEPGTVNAVEQALTLEKNVLRHQIVLAHQKTAKELEEESRRRAAAREAKRAETAETLPEQPAITAQELDEKLAEILTDDMVK